MVDVLPENRFYSFDWTRHGIAGLFESDRQIDADALSLHLWAHLWWDVSRRDVSNFNHQRLTPAWVAHARTTYARQARAFLPSDLVPPVTDYWLEVIGHQLPLLNRAVRAHDRQFPTGGATR